MCNYNFITVAPIILPNVTQNCTYTYRNLDDQEVVFRECEDPWCFALFTEPSKISRKQAILRGCQSRALMRLQNEQIKKDSSDLRGIKFDGMHFLLDQPRCHQIVEGRKSAGGDQSGCIAIMNENGTRKAQLCCCRGDDNCNENFEWNDTLYDVFTTEASELDSASHLASFGFTAIVVAVLTFMLHSLSKH
ncbi:hypothetical protein AB6A40_005381 [Gnathostoma spinigerum]|uniref:Uncharacterized protein n=1 Tax=Gnathostoma spinigerum TaxID=75299 RepID=A0ABD6EHH1_9BILA